VFVLDDNSEVSAFGNDEIYYDGELHNAANLYDALKESMYGSM
jgi:ribonucleoside-diphosphate reductase alpha chain